LALDSKVGIANRTTDISELSVSEDASHPVAELPVVAGADRSKPAAATHPLITSDGKPASIVDIAVRIPQSTAGATEDVEPSP
jgi:hypothetical protein